MNSSSRLSKSPDLYPMWLHRETNYKTQLLWTSKNCLSFTHECHQDLHIMMKKAMRSVIGKNWNKDNFEKSNHLITINYLSKIAIIVVVICDRSSGHVRLLYSLSGSFFLSCYDFNSFCPVCPGYFNLILVLPTAISWSSSKCCHHGIIGSLFVAAVWSRSLILLANLRKFSRSFSSPLTDHCTCRNRLKHLNWKTSCFFFFF